MRGAILIVATVFTLAGCMSKPMNPGPGGGGNNGGGTGGGPTGPGPVATTGTISGAVTWNHIDGHDHFVGAVHVHRRRRRFADRHADGAERSDARGR